MASSTTGSSTGSSGWTPPSVEELQELLPQYEIESVLGRGGMGAVYKGKQVALQRPVAIKVLPETLIDNDDDHQYVERFKLEARAMASLDHPAIISVFDFGQTAAGQLYFVMEFIDGMDIEQYIAASGGIVDAEHSVAIVSHVLDALDYAHSKGIVHRDIKPANVLINREGRVKIADFGLAKQFGDDAADVSGLTMTNMAMGTPDYIAPEALEVGSNPDGRADLYAVGVMLYRMLTGKLPRGMFKLPSEEIPGLDGRFDEIIALAMESDPDGRFQNASQFRGKLDDLQSEPVTRIEPQQDSGAVSPAVSGRVMQLPQQDTPRASVSSQSTPRNAPARKRKSSVGLTIGVVVGLCVVGGIIVSKMNSGDDDSDTPQDLAQVATPASQEDSVVETKKVVPSPPEPTTSAPSDQGKDSSSPKAGDSQQTSVPPEAPEKDAPSQPVALPREIDVLDTNGEWQDLMPQFTEGRRLGSGVWKAEGKQLSCDARLSYAAIGTPFELVPEFDLKFLAKRTGPGGFAITFPTADGGATLTLTGGQPKLKLAYPSKVSSREAETAVPISTEFHFSQTPQQWNIEVRSNALTVTVDGKRLITRTELDWSNFKSDGYYIRFKGTAIGFGINDSKVEIEDIMLRILSEDRKSIDYGTPPSNKPLPIPDIPDLKSRLSSYRQYRKQTIGKLITNYRTQLRTAKQSVTKSGDLTGVEQADLGLTELGSYTTSLGLILDQELIATLPLPNRSSLTIPKLAALHTNFRGSLISAEADMSQKRDQSLEACQVTLTKNNKISEAQEVRDFRNSLHLEIPGIAESPPATKIPEKPKSSKWIEMFNGSDLSGWKTTGGTNAFSVEKGTLKAQNLNAPAHLYWTDGGSTAQTAKDFEMTFRTRSEGMPANSGIYFHLAESMKYSTSKFPAQGHEIQLATEGDGITATGGLFKVVAPKFHHRKTDEWFDVRILVEGKRVQCWIDGKQTLDFTEPASLPPASPHQDNRISPVGGAIAIQANSKEGAWYFEDLRIHIIDSPVSASSDSSTLPEPEGRISREARPPAFPETDLESFGLGSLAREDPGKAEDYDKPFRSEDGNRFRVVGVYHYQNRGGFSAWNQAEYGEGIIEIDARISEGTPSWFVSLHNTNIEKGMQVFVHADGRIELSSSIFQKEGKREAELLTTVAFDRVRTFHALGILLSKRTIQVFLDGKAISNVVVLDADLSPGTMALGIRGAGEVQFEDFAVWSK